MVDNIKTKGVRIHSNKKLCINNRSRFTISQSMHISTIHHQTCIQNSPTSQSYAYIYMMQLTTTSSAHMHAILISTKVLMMNQVSLVKPRAPTTSSMPQLQAWEIYLSRIWTCNHLFHNNKDIWCMYESMSHHHNNSTNNQRHYINRIIPAQHQQDSFHTEAIGLKSIMSSTYVNHKPTIILAQLTIISTLRKFNGSLHNSYTLSHNSQ